MATTKRKSTLPYYAYSVESSVMGLGDIKLELYLVSIGHNLYKFFNKHYRLRSAA